MTLNCVAIDDEPLALGLIRSFIEQTPFLKLVGAFSNALEALPTIQKGDVHLLFLDIQMPEISGMEFSKLIHAMKDTDVRIVFTTAYNQFAIEGYRVDALFYLLKPFSYQEFLEAVMKGLHYFSNKELTSNPLLQSSEQEKSLFVKSEYKMIRIDFDDIRYIESLKDYIKIHLLSIEKPILSLMTLKSIEDKLPKTMFLRIHRSFIVSLDKIDAVGKNSVLMGSVWITVGEQYREGFSAIISRHS